MKIETANGIYEVKKPTGKLGTKHMALITRMTLPQGVEDAAELSPNQMQEVSKSVGPLFEEWCEKILPNIIVSGPFKFDDMPGEDQYAIFLAVISQLRVSQELFRIVE